MKTRFLGFFCIVISLFLSFANFFITGAVIGINHSVNIFVLIFFIGGVILVTFSFSPNLSIGGVKYDSHALDRMEERLVLPSVVKAAIDLGEHYKLKHVINDETTTGATDAYLLRDSARVLSRGRIGERIIETSSRTKPAHVIVLTGRDGVVKTVYLKDKERLDQFLGKYAYDKYSKAA